MRLHMLAERINTFIADLHLAITQPKELWSTYSNLTYGIISIPFIILLTLESVYLGITLNILMLASGLFHGVGKYVWQKADELAIYGAFLALLVYQLSPFLIIVAIPATIIAGFHHRKLSSITWGGILFGANLIILILRKGALFSLMPFMLYLIAMIIGNYPLILKKLQDYRIIGEEIPVPLLKLKLKLEAIGHDKLHGIWHLFTGSGFAFFI